VSRRRRRESEPIPEAVAPEPPRANLGLATNDELLDELRARLEPEPEPAPIEALAPGAYDPPSFPGAMDPAGRDVYPGVDVSDPNDHGIVQGLP
jgi:hypothetical protein